MHYKGNFPAFDIYVSTSNALNEIQISFFKTGPTIDS